MKWSKVRKLVEESFADSVRGRVQLFSTRYGRCTCGRGSIRIDGKEIANLCTLQFWRYSDRTVFDEPVYDPSASRKTDALADPGEFNRFDLHKACWTYLHSNVGACLASNNPLLVSLALLSSKVGKGRLRKLASQNLHPLTESLLNFRMEAEGIAEPSSGPVPK